MLNAVRLTGDWEAWLDFFAEAVIVTATQAVDTAQQMLRLAGEDREKIERLGRAAPSTLAVHKALLQHPIATAGFLAGHTGITPATVNKSLAHRVALGIVRELTQQKRNRIFSSARSIDIMNQGLDTAP